MLSDLERKLLRIMFNYVSQRHRMPTIGEIEIKTGRTRSDIYEGLHGLVKQNYIHWPDEPRLDTVVILEGWERDQPILPKTRATTSTGSNIDYWTKY
ncbi:hypothetical protein D3C74_333010 [compost metagenome]